MGHFDGIATRVVVVSGRLSVQGFFLWMEAVVHKPVAMRMKADTVALCLGGKRSP